MRTRLLVSSAIILLFAGAAFGQIRKDQKAPDFTLPDLDGNNVTLSEIIGDGPVYIDFWATWCKPCKRAIPGLVKLYNEYKDRGLKVIAISTDDSRSQGKVKSFTKNYKMDFTILLDASKEVSSRKYKVRGIPQGFLLDNEGNIIYAPRGYIPGLEKILAEKMEPYLISAEENESEANETTEKTSTSEDTETEK